MYRIFLVISIFIPVFSSCVSTRTYKYRDFTIVETDDSTIQSVCKCEFNDIGERIKDRSNIRACYNHTNSTIYVHKYDYHAILHELCHQQDIDPKLCYEKYP